MELHTKTHHEAQIRDRLQALEYEVHALRMDSGSLARKFGLTENPVIGGSFLSVSESLEEGEILEFPYIIYWPAARKQVEIQRRTKALENGIRIMKWNLGLSDTMSNPVPSFVDRSLSKDMMLKSTSRADSYCLAPEFEALLYDLQNAVMIEANQPLYYTSTAAHPTQQKENEIMMAHHFRRHENPEIAGTIPHLDPKLHACRIKANPHPYFSIKHSILRDLIFDANCNISNNVYSLFLRRECKPRYRYNFNELEADMFYDWEWLRFLHRGDTLAGDIEVLCMRNQKFCGMIHHNRTPVFEDRAALWPSVVFEQLKPDFREIERAGFRVLAWQLCNVDGIVPLWLDRHGFWISGVPV
ncbi:hypothetical protein FGADI_8115 [Fusarium gaditjirri]|uniref:Uncharacterized protein n=1 Tax=Fusarium gaditjirri TaxID=282569 RepID=A0A8H4T3C2_9HYPO|nr:hypothetical protein FGADI_8115 [Fusarium gaditjirri]